MQSSNQQNVRILGVDPGSHKTGWGIIDVNLRTRKLTHVDNGVFMLSAKENLWIRLVEISESLSLLIKEYAPHRAAVEDIFMQKSAQSALILGQARGAVLATVGVAGLQVFTHAPTQVKSRVVGKGRAGKDQIGLMVKMLLNLPEVPFEDAADALAVSICHATELLSPLPKALQNLPKSLKRKVKVRQGFKDLARSQGKL